jgi:hypothetical protein
LGSFEGLDYWSCDPPDQCLSFDGYSLEPAPEDFQFDFTEFLQTNDSGYSPANQETPGTISPFPLLASSHSLASSTPSTTNDAPNLLPPEPLKPLLKTCLHCGTSVSTGRLASHLKAHSNARFPCATDTEPGCNAIFKDSKGRRRHREESCKHIQAGPIPLSAYICCCGKLFKRWDRLKKHWEECSTVLYPGKVYNCKCEALFPSTAALEEHHNTKHKKRPGRPRKGGRLSNSTAQPSSIKTWIPTTNVRDQHLTVLDGPQLDYEVKSMSGLEDAQYDRPSLETTPRHIR